jgi:hypothetical protein
MKKEYMSAKGNTKFSSRAFPRRWGDPLLWPIQRRKGRWRGILQSVRAEVPCASPFSIWASEEARHEAGLGRHGGAIIGIGKKNFFFGCKALREHQCVSERTGDRSDPRGVNQRQEKHFEKHGGVIRMTHVAKRSGGDDAKLGRVHHLHVPVLAKRSNDPPPNDVSHNNKYKRDCAKKR